MLSAYPAGETTIQIEFRWQQCLETWFEKYKKVLRLLEERNWQEMEDWLHEDFMYIEETALIDREEHDKK